MMQSLCANNAASPSITMLSDRFSRPLAASLAASATVATFAKSFTPYYLIGSTAIFVAACLIGLVLLALSWRRILDAAGHVRVILAAMGLVYAIVIASYFTGSFHQVPLTHLLGILIFHAMFLLFGFASAGALTVVFAILLAQGVAYFIIFGQYALRFADFVRDGFLQNVFGLGPDLALAIHQQVGSQVALAALAAIGLGFGSGFGLASGRARRLLSLAFAAFALLFMYHLQARTAIVALFCSFAFIIFAVFYARRKALALPVLSSVVISAAFACALFFQYALHANIDPKATDPISRTMQEIQEPRPGLRLAIWSGAWHRLISEPDRLLLGRGIGAYPIDEGFGPPDWLLHATEGAKHYPHNVHLEILYETGILGFLAYSFLILLPLAGSIKYWTRLSVQQKLAVAMYVYYVVTMEISGAFAFAYDFQFFLAIAIGIIALKRKEIAGPSAHLDSKTVVRRDALGRRGTLAFDNLSTVGASNQPDETFRE
jgi:O-antigen ligase